MKKGHLIAIEGIDGVGKNTQAKLLRDHIVGTKGECGFFSFPRYDTPTGALVGEYLKSNRTDLNLFEKANLYIRDRLAAKEEILSYLDRGVDVVCDRYTLSNLVYMTSIAELEHADITNFARVVSNYLALVEYQLNKLPVVDTWIILSLPLNHYDKMMESKEKREYTDQTKDRHEGDAALIKRCHEKYNSYKDGGSFDHLHVPTDHYNVVFCNGPDDSIMNIEDIHKVVVTKYEGLNKVRFNDCAL